MNGRRHRSAAPRAPQLSGCLTCRRRRVKCDRTTPACGACRRLRLECLSRPAEERFLWLPVNQVQVGIDSEPCEQLGDQTRDQEDALQTERTTQARRTALATDKERIVMCQQLLQSTAHRDVDDILNSLRTFAEAGVGAVSSGPFNAFPAFPTQTVQAMDITPDLCPSTPLISGPSPSGSNNGSRSSLSFGALLDVLPGELLHQSDETVDILSSVLEPDWEESILSGIDFDTLPLDFTQGSSSYAFNTLELQSEAPTFELPSPLSFHLPFLQPSQILERIPKDTFSLIEYYGSRMLFFHSPFPSHKPPWKILHHPSVLETTTALLVAAPVKHAQLALLYAILAISSFHIDWCTVSGQQSQSGNSPDQTDNARSYWWNIGQQFERDAKLQLQLALKGEFAGATKAKYKHILMTLLCMVTICVSTGKMDDARCFLLDAERVIRLRGLLKPHLSKKVRLLHNIFLYNRIIEESTFCYAATRRSELRSSQEPSTQPFLPRDDVVDAVLLSRNHDGDGNGSVHDRDAARAELSLSEQLITNDGAWFETIYGIPMTLMHLISQTTSLVHEADTQHSLSPSADLHSMASFARRAHTLEDLICGFRWGPTQEGHEGHIIVEPSGKSQTPCPAVQASVHSNVMRHLVSAMHQALLIFFYRRIRKLNSYALQSFVKRTLSDLCAFQRAKEENNIVTPVICWPGFIAGAEALEEEERQQFRQWFRQSGRGWRNFDTIGEIVENLWKAKGRSGSRAGEVTWEHFFKEHQIAIIST